MGKGVMKLIWIDDRGRRCTSFVEVALPIPEDRWNTITFGGVRTLDELDEVYK